MRFVKTLAVLGLSVLINFLVSKAFEYSMDLQIERQMVEFNARAERLARAGQVPFLAPPDLHIEFAMLIASAAGAIPLGIYFTLVQDARSAGKVVGVYLLFQAVAMAPAVLVSPTVAEVLRAVASVGIGALAGYSAGGFLGRRAQPLFWERVRVMG